MRTTIYIPFIAGILIYLISCSKQDGIKLQAHDAKRVMDSLHAMMNRMQVLPPTNDPDIMKQMNNMMKMDQWPMFNLLLVI